MYEGVFLYFVLVFYFYNHIKKQLLKTNEIAIN